MSVSRDYFEIEAELKSASKGDIHFDKFSRLLYSTDASIYQIEPIGVVVPRHKRDVQAVIEVANRLGVSVLSRGGGTSLAGQTVGHSIVVDFSKYMHNVLEVNREELWCRVEPGLVQDELNAYVRAPAFNLAPIPRLPIARRSAAWSATIPPAPIRSPTVKLWITSSS